jgi:peptidyl-prolyl cis-trans isomerase C
MKQGLAVMVLLTLAAGIAIAGGSAAVIPDDVYRAYVARDFASAERILKGALAGATDADARFALSVELGDLYLDKKRDYPAAESSYKALIEQYPNQPNVADVVYRLAVADEREEEYLDAAQGYEKVAIKYQGSTYAEDALNAIERCFRKNYQERAAYVDSYPITRLEFDDMVSRSPSQYEKFEDKLKLVNQMIDDRLLYAEAVRIGLDRNPDFLSQMQDFRRDQMMQAWYDREVVKKVVVDDSMKSNYYREHKSDYVTPEQVKAREIQVRTRAAAESLRTLIVDQKQPFESLAKANSVAPTKDRGGDMGTFRRNTRAKEIDEAAFALKPGEVSHVIKTGDSSFTILKLDEKRERKEKSLDDVASEIESRLRPQKTQERLAKLLESQKKGHVVQDTLAIAQNKDTLALVDGLPIRAADLSKMMERIPPTYRAQFESPEGKKRILDQLLTERLVLQRAEQDKYWLGNELIGQSMDRERQLLTSMLKKQEITDKVKVADKLIQDEYKKTIKDFKVPEQVRAKEIVLKSRDEAIALHKKLTDPKQPLSFDSMARTVSASASRWAAGDMGLISRGQKPKPVDQALFSLSPKTVSNVIKVNDSNYVILKVEEHHKASTRPLSEVQSKLEHKLRQDVEKNQTEAYLGALRQKAKIEILLTEENTAPPSAETIPLAPAESGNVTVVQPPQPTPTETKPTESKPGNVLASVYFAFDKVTLLPSGHTTLDALARLLKAQPDLQIVVIGRTDRTGSDEYNNELALRRARKVVAQLEQAGIAANRMEARSAGRTEAGRQAPWKDRRVDILGK